ncbi:MAG TPA: hypothetical protein VIH11_10020 [Gemmatimonadaceae bacterium]|nr:hypothetical protein [Gemmatimonadaceae bacterium]
MSGAARLAVVVAALVAAAPARAQDRGNGFLFGKPSGSFGIHGGYAIASAGSDLFSFTTEQLTLNRGSFNAFSIGAEVAFSLKPTLDLVVGTTYARTSHPSEFRDWVDNNNLPIQQTTSFTRWPVTASLKWYLTPRGRSLGKFAWVPAKYAPYVGLGAGRMWYSFAQEGDFIDYDTKNVFGDTFKSSGWTATAHALAGVEYSLTPRLALSSEARYQYANASPGVDFVGFHRIDLSGFAATVGLTVRY